MSDHMLPTRGLQKRKCPHCGREIQFYDYQTWIDHLKVCKGTTKYAVLKRITECREQDVAIECGYKNLADMYSSLGVDSIVGYWDKAGETNIISITDLFKVKREKIGPVLIIVHGRLFNEYVDGLTTGETAYVKEEDYERMF